jgi:hypothetical protein
MTACDAPPLPLRAQWRVPLLVERSLPFVPRPLPRQAASIEACCDWAAALRDAIRVASGKQLAYEDEEGRPGN